MAVEFLMFSRTVVLHFVPTLLPLYMEDQVKEEHLIVPLDAIPDDVAVALLSRFHALNTANAPIMSFLGSFLSRSTSALILYSRRRFQECIGQLNLIAASLSAPVVHDLTIFSPPHLVPPSLVLAAWLMLQLGQLETYMTCCSLLRHYSKIGYTIAKSGFEVLEAFKERHFPDQITEQGLPQNLQPEGLIPIVPEGKTIPQFTGSGLSLPSSPPASSPPSGQPVQAPSLDEEIETRLEIDDTMTPMDALFTFLDPDNEQKLLEELEPLFLGL